jgi:hypothetical protein
MSNVFRQVSLDRLSSPEQLDELMKVTNPRSWLAFLALSSLLVIAVYWGIAGNIPLQVAAPTILLNSGGIKNLIALEEGQIVQLYIQTGDIVTVNQLIAEIVPLGGGAPAPVYSPYHGRIIELKTDAGNLIRRGDSLANLEFVGDDVHLEAALYLAPEDSRSVAVGMPVKIVPRVGSSNRNLALTGTVTSVSDFPLSRAGILRVLGSDELVQTLVKSNTPIEVRVTIDSSATSRAELSASGIKTGTLANATILIGNQRPIDLVIPLR